MRRTVFFILDSGSLLPYFPTASCWSPKGVAMQKLNVPGPKALALIERDKKVISSSYPRGYPFVMDHGKGVEVWDPDGNRFIDFMSGIAVLSTGHAHPKVVKAVQDAAET